MTGRYCPAEVLKVSKRVVEVEEIKHYFTITNINTGDSSKRNTHINIRELS